MIMGMVLGAAWGAVLAAPLLLRARRVRVRARAVVLEPRERRDRGSRSGPRGLPLGAVARVAGGLRRWAARRTRVRVVDRAVPVTLDLLMVASLAGCTPRLAIPVAERWSPPVLAGALAGVTGRCRLGSSLSDSLDELAATEPRLRPLAEALAVAERTGAPAAELLARLADEARASLRRRAEAHARRVPVRLLFPLVFLVLPAFGLLTVVPALLAGLRSP